MRRAVAAGVVGLVVLTLAGCTGEEPEIPGLTATPSATETPSATPTPTPTSTDSQIAGTLVDLSDPELGIVFEDVPELTGDAADVYNWISTYEVEVWRALTTNQVSPGVAQIASPGVVSAMETNTATNAENQIEIDGTFTVTVSRITVDGDTAAGVVCHDYSQVTFADPAGEYTPEEVGFGDRKGVSLTLERRLDAVGIWTVATTEATGTC